MEYVTARGVASVGGSKYGILVGIYASFGENHEKLWMARSTSATGNSLWELNILVDYVGYHRFHIGDILHKHLLIHLN